MRVEFTFGDWFFRLARKVNLTLEPLVFLFEPAHKRCARGFSGTRSSDERTKHRVVSRLPLLTVTAGTVKGHKLVDLAIDRNRNGSLGGRSTRGIEQ